MQANNNNLLMQPPSSNNPLRRAQRAYHCYVCNNAFRMLISVGEEAESAVSCPVCHSDFIEEAKSYEQL